MSGEYYHERKLGMPLLEPVNAETLKKYPFWWNWIEELQRSPEDVLDFTVRTEIKEVDPVDGWKRYEPTGKHTAFIYFNDGSRVSRPVKLTENEIIALPEEAES